MRLIIIQIVLPIYFVPKLQDKPMLKTLVEAFFGVVRAGLERGNVRFARDWIDASRFQSCEGFRDGGFDGLVGSANVSEADDMDALLCRRGHSKQNVAI